jgi:hypothetical protein
MQVNARVMYERPFEYSHRRGKKDAVLSIRDVLSIEDSTRSLHGQPAREQRKVFLDNLRVIIRSVEVMRVDVIQVRAACRAVCSWDGGDHGYASETIASISDRTK